MSYQLSITERLRQIEADEFMQLLISSKNKEEPFLEFLLMLSPLPCTDRIVINNLELMYQSILEYNYEFADAVLGYFFRRNTIFLNINDIKWHLLDTNTLPLETS